MHAVPPKIVFICAGVSALVSQFPSVDQFRWVGWFNMALGVMSLFLLFTLFHGEWKSPYMTKAKKKKDSTVGKRRCLEFFTKTSTLKIVVSTSYLITKDYSVSHLKDMISLTHCRFWHSFCSLAM